MKPLVKFVIGTISIGHSFEIYSLYTDFKDKLDRWLPNFKLVDSEYYRTLCAIGMTESSLNQILIGGMGEIGLMQIYPPTAERLNLDQNRLLTDWLYNIRAGQIVFEQNLQKYDYITAINRYNSRSLNNLENFHYIQKVLKHLETVYLYEMLN